MPKALRQWLIAPACLAAIGVVALFALDAALIRQAYDLSHRSAAQAEAALKNFNQERLPWRQ